MREGWEIKTLEDLFDIGSSKRVYESQWRNAGVPFYRAREIVKLSRDGFVDNELFIDEELYKEYANKYGTPKCGDIMVTGVGTLGVCYIVKKNDKFYFKDGNILWFKSKEGTNPFYVNYAFKSNYLRQQIDNCNGATVGTFTIVRAKKTTIPVPPLAEQERIVAELDLLSSIIDNKKAQLKELDQLAQSIFYDMFGDPITNEKGWEVKKLGDVVSPDCSISYGIVQPGEDITDGIPIVRPVDLTNTRVSRKGLKRVDKSISDAYKRTILKGNEILFCVRGTTGVVSFASEELCGCNVTRGITPLSFDNKANSYFIFYLIKSDGLQSIISDNTRGIALKQINMKDVRLLPIILPPISLQQEFADKVEAIERQKTLIQQSIVETQTLFDGRMDYWFG